MNAPEQGMPVEIAVALKEINFAELFLYLRWRREKLRGLLEQDRNIEETQKLRGQLLELSDIEKLPARVQTILSPKQ